MKNFASLAAFAAGANALVSRADSCCFHLTASGAVSGTVGQLGDGQNRIGGGLAAASFCIDSNGAITDSSGRGCIVTNSVTQFQCDLGSTAQTGFSISSGGQLQYQGSSNFVACQTGDNNELNIYTTESSSVLVRLAQLLRSPRFRCPSPADQARSFQVNHLPSSRAALSLVHLCLALDVLRLRQSLSPPL
ncbi:uncharacterized protein BP01DRAFT_380516 [Aspergillus saccharolyticus JOP 1030-1]|uniref:Cell wall mannoprotein PIR1-like C-terminal domain-containing protein n=1 Tax=Aspergillus saccharolyticus JOP 1030-1 TaxID=1450539 RepID=A0A318ZIB1_9EURO|nr:hypothetical protein BP01DRAFT_380516 [Aspergillus saccharolyticus JOP 1030-1]PYH47296.1 hypothetical protein BP01DRAFT_380516 [Aspergillus saccharolyticus JOP 1030-1]